MVLAQFLRFTLHQILEERDRPVEFLAHPISHTETVHAAKRVPMIEPLLGLPESKDLFIQTHRLDDIAGLPNGRSETLHTGKHVSTVRAERGLPFIDCPHNQSNALLHPAILL